MSSPARFERRIGKATWRGRSEWRGSKARTAVGKPGPVAAVQQRRLGRPGDHRPGPVGQGHLARVGDVDRREVDEVEDRLVRVERADARPAERAGHRPERRRLRRARSPGSAGPAAGSGRAPSKMMRSNFSGWVVGPELVERHAVQLGAGQVGQGRLEVRVAGADEEDPPQPVRAARPPRPGRRSRAGRPGAPSSSVRRTSTTPMSRGRSSMLTSARETGSR